MLDIKLTLKIYISFGPSLDCKGQELTLEEVDLATKVLTMNPQSGNLR